MILGPLWIIKMMSSQGQLYLTNVSPSNPVFEIKTNILQENSYFCCASITGGSRENMFVEDVRSLRCWKGLCVEFIPELCVCVCAFFCSDDGAPTLHRK